jgi:hypothetical protein
MMGEGIRQREQEAADASDAARIREHRRQCPICGSTRIGWSDWIVTPGISKRTCKNCKAVWSPGWRRRNGWLLVILGPWGIVAGIYGAVFEGVLAIAAGEFEYVCRFYNFFLPRPVWPYWHVVMSVCIVGVGVVFLRTGIRLLRGELAEPRVISCGRGSGEQSVESSWDQA